MMDGAGMTTTTPAPRAKAEIEAIYPLSQMQQGMAFHTLYSPDSGMYAVQLHCTLEGALNQSAFARAWERVIARHPVLRTLFVLDQPERPLQVVRRHVESPLVIEDWSELDETAQRARMDEFAAEERRRGFALDRAPLMRLLLARCGPERHRFHWLMHHAIVDGWSLPIVLGEFFTLYELERRGETFELPRPPAYRDYIDWLGRQDLASAERHWRGLLEGFEEPTPLPGAAAASGDADFTARRVTYQLPAALTAAIQALARRLQLTPSTVLQAAWAVLLARHAGTRDVVWGATVSGRPAELPGIEKMVGLFINTLPLRARLEPGLTVTALLRRLHDLQSEIRQYEYTPLLQVQQWAGLPRGRALFESILVYENFPVGAGAAGGGAPLTVCEIGTYDSTNYPLTLIAAPGERMSLRFMHDPRRIDNATVDRLARRYENLLAAIAADPEQAVDSLPMLEPDERERVLIEWNATAADYPSDQPLHRLFEARAAGDPDRVAVEGRGKLVTCGELHARANRLARALRARGAGRGSIVAVAVERGPAMVEALLAVMKSGAAYLPVDPGFPAARIAFMLEDAGAVIAVTDRASSSVLPASLDRIDLDADRERLALLDASPLDGGAEATDPAYVLYTSGSTGRPKGVVVGHRALVNFLFSMAECPGLDATDILAAVTTLSFDIAGLEIYLPLLAGGRVAIIDRETAADGEALARALDDCGATALQATPATWQMLLRAGWRGRPGLKALCGGEALPRELADRLLPCVGELWNMYGPTETTIWSTLDRVETSPAAITIGRPIANTRVYVLDDRMEPVPAGVAGELWIGGDGVADGYLGRPELTAERFLPNPFVPGTRIYRTGDLARWLDDGRLDCLGRVDHQVKLRGFRIELGEIEAALLALPGVAQAAAAVREDTPGDPRLVAYLVMREGAPAPAAEELRRHARERLPDYMVPSFFPILDALPLTPNGKLDRKALPAPSAATAAPAAAFEAPIGELEQKVAETFGKVLRAPRVGRHDNFFALGGHSLLATQVITRLRRELERELPLRWLFEHATVAELAAAIDGEAGEADSESSAAGIEQIPLRPRGVPHPLSHAQQRLWFLDQLDPGNPAYNIPGAVQLVGPLDIAALDRALNEIVRRHETLRTTIQTRAGRPVQVIADFVPREWPFVDLATIPEEQRRAEGERLGRDHALYRFALDREPPFHAMLVRVVPDLHVFAFVFHHIASDGWSLGIFVNELVTLYEAYRKDEPSPLPPLAVQYVDYAAWRERHLREGAFDADMEYWRKRLAGSSPSLDLPSDRPRPPRPGFLAGEELIQVPEVVVEAMKALEREEGVTPFMTLMAAFKSFLAHLGGQRDITIGTVIAGRQRPEVEPLIGCFLNTLAMRTVIDGDPSFRALLRQVREEALGAYSHQDVPFERLLEELNPERNAGSTPFFQAMLVVQNAPVEPVTQSEMSIRMLPLRADRAKVDLNFHFFAAGDSLAGWMQYSRDLFDAPTIRRMLDQFVRLLSAAVADPDRALSTLPLLDDGERLALDAPVHAVSDPPGDPWPEEGTERTVAEAFAAQAARRAAEPALIGPGRMLTYAELDARARSLAAAIAATGADRIGILFRDKFEAVIAMLAAVRAGVVYVPLDPAYPVARLAWTIGDAGCDALLAEPLCAELAAAIAGPGRTVITTADPAPAAAAALHNPSPDDPVYILYTSGSSGRPKGVVQSHRGLLRQVRAYAIGTGLRADDRLTLISSYTFDAAVVDVWSALLAGAALCPWDLLMQGLAELGDWLAEGKVTVYHSTPSIYRTLLASTRADLAGSSLRRVVLGGEEARPADAALFAERFPAGSRLYNLYGMSECSIVSLRLVDAAEAGAGRLSIGDPVVGARIELLNDAGLPVDLCGEIAVTGPHVAAGYWNRPDLTGERFAPAAEGLTRYRTGDLGRRRADGRIEYLGRRDGQLKIRGHRVETGEVEAVIAMHPSIRQVAVVGRTRPDGDSELIAYVVGRDERPDQAILRDHLRRHLPAHMMPAGMIGLDALPLTPNGKLDRAALPEPTGAGFASSEPYQAPEGPVEELLAELWQELLSRDGIGRRDSFFALGGHSLMATQMVSMLRERLEIDLPLRLVFERPVLEEMAAAVETLLLEELDADEAAEAVEADADENSTEATM